MLAVVLAVPPAAEADASPEEAAPVPADTRLAGLTLLLRALLTLQKEGADRIIVVHPEGEDQEQLVERCRADPRLADTEVQSLAIQPGQSPMAALGDAVDDRFVLARYDVVADPAIYRALAATSLGEQLGVLATEQGEPIGPLVGTPALLEQFANDDARLSLAQLLADEPRVGSYEVGEGWWARAATRAGRQRAVHHLFEACRKPEDGIISRHLNRHVSIFVSKRIVNLPISPNGMTIATFGLAILGAVCAVRGGYWPTLAAGALMQLNSIFDGVDGELARVRFQGSKLGQWLDTIGDDASNVLYYAALAVGAQSIPHYGPWLAAAGWLGAVMGVLAAAQYYPEIARAGSGDLGTIDWEFDKRPPVTVKEKILVAFRYGLKQDFFIFSFFCFAVGGFLSYALPVIALGATITAVAAFVRNVSRRFRKKGEAKDYQDSSR